MHLFWFSCQFTQARVRGPTLTSRRSYSRPWTSCPAMVKPAAMSEPAQWGQCQSQPSSTGNTQTNSTLEAMAPSSERITPMSPRGALLHDTLTYSGPFLRHPNLPNSSEIRVHGLIAVKTLTRSPFGGCSPSDFVVAEADNLPTDLLQTFSYAAEDLTIETATSSASTR